MYTFQLFGSYLVVMYTFQLLCSYLVVITTNTRGISKIIFLAYV